MRSRSRARWQTLRYFSSDHLGRYAGGLVALDGVHPTTIGYGLVAHEICTERVIHVIEVVERPPRGLL